MGTGGRRGRGCVAPTLHPGRQVLRPSKGLPSPPRIPAHRSTPRLHERPLPLPRAAPPTSAGGPRPLHSLGWPGHSGLESRQAHVGPLPHWPPL